MIQNVIDAGLWSLVDHPLVRFEWGDYRVGQKLTLELVIKSLDSMEITRNKTKAIKQVNLGVYDAVGKVRYYSKDEGIILDFGVIYAVIDEWSEEWPEVKYLRNGSFVKTRFSMGLKGAYSPRVYTVDDPNVPKILYNWEITDILAVVNDAVEKVRFKKLPVEHVSSDGRIYKRIEKTDGYKDGASEYIFLCKKLD
ncbi:MAG: hypothetical protein L7F77_13045 [Candidatus Magnetominusculus sp. LBB02]|nr:hypothetical protein [Candidatus Magnetominusculus sp. LBB02]